MHQLVDLARYPDPGVVQFQNWHGRRFSFLTTGLTGTSQGHVRVLKSGATFTAGPVLLGSEQTIPPVINNNNTGGHIIFEDQKKTRDKRACFLA